jgi:hypothetical protein
VQLPYSHAEQKGYVRAKVRVLIGQGRQLKLEQYCSVEHVKESTYKGQPAVEWRMLVNTSEFQPVAQEGCGDCYRQGRRASFLSSFPKPS